MLESHPSLPRAVRSAESRGSVNLTSPPADSLALQAQEIQQAELAFAFPGAIQSLEHWLDLCC